MRLSILRIMASREPGRFSKALANPSDEAPGPWIEIRAHPSRSGWPVGLDGSQAGNVARVPKVRIASRRRHLLTGDPLMRAADPDLDDLDGLVQECRWIGDSQ
jgi:hypothetical protein